MLGFKAGQLERRGNAGDKGNQFMIKEWRSGFQGNSHAHPIHFHQNVARQVSLAIDIKKRVERLITFDLANQLLKQPRRVTPVFQLSRKTSSVQRLSVQTTENGNTIKISCDWIEGDVVQVISSPGGMWESQAQRAHDALAKRFWQ